VFAPSTAGAPSIVVVSGAPQSTPVGRTFGTTLQVKVIDGASNPIAGALVTFTTPSSGASATFGGLTSVSVNTNTAGIATAPVLTANNTAGSYSVTASAAGVPTTATFSLTNGPAGGAVPVTGFTIFGAAVPQTFVTSSTPAEVGVGFRS